jgi:hypothetical protein
MITERHISLRHCSVQDTCKMCLSKNPKKIVRGVEVKFQILLQSTVGQTRMGLLHFSHIVLDRNRPVRWSFVLKYKLTLGSQFFGVFLSNRFLKATKDENVHFFSHGRNRVNYTTEFQEI